MRALAVHTGMAVVAIALALASRPSTEVVAPAGAPLVDCAARSLRFEAGDRTVRLARDGHGAEVAIERDGEELRFAGGDEALAWLDWIGALSAARTLGPVDDLAAFGLADAADLVVSCEGGETVVLAVGAALHGVEDRYVRDAAGAVHVVPAPLFRALDSAEVLWARKALHDFDDGAIGAVELTVGEHTVLSVQRFAEDPSRRRWVHPDRPDELAPRFDRLMGAHRNLEAASAVEQPADPASEPLGRMRYLDADGRELGWLELRRLGTGPGATFYARTERLGWVPLPAGPGAAFAEALARAVTR